jgi:type 2 lantibiotic biosynthesis protein LanM
MIPGRAGRWWSSALTLAERAALLPDPPVHSAGRSAGATDVTPDRRPIDRWRTQRPFDRADFLARRLGLDRLTVEHFESLLATPPETLGISADPPAWVSAVERADALASQIAQLPRSDAGADASGLAPLRAFVEPFVTSGMARLYEEARTIVRDEPGAPFEPKHATLLFEPHLWGQLIGRAMKVVILELNVARVCGTLGGSTPEARCADFARQLRAGPVRDQIIAEYPVLVRSMAGATDDWLAAAAEFLRHLATDGPALRDAFAGGAGLGELVTLGLGAGDVHRHGRSVTIAEFSAGLRLVYKPRALAVDRHFHELIEWINARGQTPPLRAVRTISVGDHGWAEFVPHDPCESPDAVGRFYDRFGACIAILHALNATDFHYENVIACGEYPMLIDLEALFHPQADAARPADEPEGLGWEVLQRSVLRTGVLPFRAYDSEQSSGLDLSAMGGSGGQQTPNRFPVLVAAGTDEMRFERDFVRLPASQNRPTLGGQAVDPAAFAERVIEGFTSAYRLLLTHRDDLLSPGGPLHRFADDPIRVVLRPTRQYALILAETHHPDVLRDALERDRLIDRLWVAVPARPELEQVVKLEHEDLAAGDVPLFMSRPASCALITTRGSELSGFFRQSGLESAVQRIDAMSEHDLMRQRWVISAALVALASGNHGDAGPRPAERPRHRTPAPPSRDEIVDAARGVGRRLVRLALRRGDLVSWLGLTLVRERDWVVQPVGADLYGGSIGIALFLAYLDHIAGDEDAGDIARAVADQVMSRLATTVDSPDADTTLPPGALGAFGTLGGGVYALSHLAALWRAPAPIDVAGRVTSMLARHVTTDRSLDIIAGTAGFIMAAGTLDHVRPSDRVATALRHAADSLVASARTTADGLCWATTVAASRPLSGASHGASGMALALMTAGRILCDGCLVDAALEAMRYERATIDADRMNWPDFRIIDGRSAGENPPVMWAWCHGAPGIGLVRLAALGVHLADDVHEDLKLALESTARFGLGSNDSLCHGDLGNLDLLIEARALGYTGTWEQALDAHAARLVARLRAGRWYCGIPGGLETPGLMMGLAGIGYGLLRLADPERVPSVLALEPPRLTSLDWSDE